jgi:RNA polymerase sigma-54 factor
MKMGYGLSLEQVQKLIMTPELRQAIQILQLSALELNNYINEEMDKNPLLERVEEHKDEIGSTSSISLDDRQREKVDWKEFLRNEHETEYYYHAGGSSETDEKDVSYENITAHSVTLQEHLIFQLHMVRLNEHHKKIARFIIESMDPNGYFRMPITEVSDRFRIDTETVQEVLLEIQSFDPPGVGARNLEECLKIQLEHSGNLDEEIEAIIDNHLEDVAANRINILSKALGISQAQCQNYCDIIKSLEPKPGRSFASKDDVRYIVPDVIIDKISNEYIVTVNDSSAPRLSVNNYYRRILNVNDKDSDISKYLSHKLDSAMWVIKSIEQRRQTLYKVVKAIVEYQMEYFEMGTEGLKPLNLKDVADKVQVHESTVSRAIKDKYAQTPRGILPLKFFFSTKMENSMGDDISTSVIKKRIREIIESENPQKPISDQKIADMLEKEQIEISRRTVAKYRDELNISSTSKRKRY